MWHSELRALSKDDDVMADSGFTIKNSWDQPDLSLLRRKGVTLNIPSLAGKDQLSQEKVTES